MVPNFVWLVTSLLSVITYRLSYTHLESCFDEEILMTLPFAELGRSLRVRRSRDRASERRVIGIFLDGNSLRHFGSKQAPFSSLSLSLSLSFSPLLFSQVDTFPSLH